nr:hypothetical protein [Tanacetum cinerariifolium]
TRWPNGMFATVTVFMVDGSLKHVLLGKDRNADDPHTFTDLYLSSSDPVFAEDYGTMGLRYGTPNLSAGATFVLYTCCGLLVLVLSTPVEDKPFESEFITFLVMTGEANESLAKHKALELKIERLLRAVVSHDIISVVQNNSVVETSNLQTELERTKERFENYIIQKENEYAKLWNDWYKKCEECEFDKISYDKAYNDMQQKIERLQAQLGDLKGKCKDTSCVSDTLNSLSQKLENENVELEFQVLNHAR